MTLTQNAKKDRSILRQEAATVLPTNHPVKESVMTQFTNFPTAPAGFFKVAGEGPWQGEFHGPKAGRGNVEVTSVWNHISREIEFNVYSTVDGHSNFDRAELEAIPELIKRVLACIDKYHAVEVMTAHPVPRANPEFHTVTEIAVWCDTHKINPIAGFAAFTELHGEEYGLKGGDMLSTEAPTAELKSALAPVELHYWPRSDIEAGIETKSLCGEIAVPATGSSQFGAGTSYTCPDCMLRYTLLLGDDNA